VRGECLQLLAPNASTAGQLKHTTRRAEFSQSECNQGGIRKPLGVERRATIVTPLPQPPLVILTCARPVVFELLAESRGVFG